MLVHLAALFWEGRRMIESLMLCGIGLLAGCLLMLLFFPAVHQRAVRLTRRDLIDATPLTAKEIQVEKDQLRAQFAVSVRRQHGADAPESAGADGRPANRGNGPSAGRARQKECADLGNAHARRSAQTLDPAHRQASVLFVCAIEPA